MSQLKETTHKTLVAQASDQLVSKLKGGKLFGVSKEVAIEILTERKEKGKFDGDIDAIIKGSIGGAAEEKGEGKKKAEGEKAAAPKEKKEKGPSKASQKFPDFKLKFKKDQEVEFTPFRTNKKVKGTVISSYPWQPKKGEVREDVRVRVGDKVYVKKGSEVTIIK